MCLTFNKILSVESQLITIAPSDVCTYKVISDAVTKTLVHVNQRVHYEMLLEDMHRSTGYYSCDVKSVTYIDKMKTEYTTWICLGTIDHYKNVAAYLALLKKEKQCIIRIPLVYQLLHCSPFTHYFDYGQIDFFGDAIDRAKIYSNDPNFLRLINRFTLLVSCNP